MLNNVIGNNEGKVSGRSGTTSGLEVFLNVTVRPGTPSPIFAYFGV